MNYSEVIGTSSRIRIVRSYGNLQSYWTSTKPWKLTVVLDYYEYMFLVVPRSVNNFENFICVADNFDVLDLLLKNELLSDLNKESVLGKIQNVITF